MITHIAKIGVLGSILAAIIIAITALSLTAEAQEPESDLTFSKSAEVDGHTVHWTLSVTNSGDADSDSQTVQDTLPAGTDWAISDQTGGCVLVESSNPGRLKLDCDQFIVPARNLDGEDTDGSWSVTISGFVEECGDLTNVGLFNVALVRSVTVNIPCPATPTPVPTATPVVVTPLPTLTPTPEPTPTKTPIANIPLPPRTGNSAPVTLDAGPNPYAYIGTLVILLGVGTVAFAVRRNR